MQSHSPLLQSESSRRVYAHTRSQYSFGSISCRFSVASIVSSGIVTSTPKAKREWDPFLTGGTPIATRSRQSRLESISESIYANHAKQWLTDDECISGAVLDVSVDLDSIHGRSPLPSCGACPPQVSSSASCGICSDCLYSNPWSSPSPAMKLRPVLVSRPGCGLPLRRASSASSLHHSFQKQQEALFSPRPVSERAPKTTFDAKNNVFSMQRCDFARDMIHGSDGPPAFTQSGSLAGLDLLVSGEGCWGGLTERILDARLEFSTSERGSWGGLK